MVNTELTPVREEQIPILTEFEEDPMMAFTTKYYMFKEPGKMAWGHQDEVIEMYHLE